MGIHFNNITMLFWLWSLPCLGAVFYYAARRRGQACRQFADAGILPRLNVSASATRRAWKAAGLLAAAAFIFFALARPAWNPVPREIQRQGRDVVFLLDVSSSMLADDLAPNRLERAKLAIRDCIGQLQGDRVALVAFAGTAVIKCPLTLDYGFFRLMLEDISTNSVERGGTLIGDALRRTLEEVFDDQQKKFKDIILITDGEDHDSFPVKAAEEAGLRGLRLIAIGLGDEDQGQRIPITDASGNRTFLKYEGQEVWSKLDAETLRNMAAATEGGKYLNVATGTFDLGQIYTDLIASAEQKALESETVTRYEEKFQIFAAVAFALLCIEAATSERKRVKA